MGRDMDADAFPPGTRVVTPTGRAGVVLRHIGHKSKRDSFVRVLVQLEGGRRHDRVTLQPRWLVKCPAPLANRERIGQ